MTNIRTNLTQRYLPVKTHFSGFTNADAQMPWLVDFDYNGFGFGGVVCLEYDKGEFVAGIYAEVETGRWSLGLKFEDLHKYAFGDDYSIEIFYNVPEDTEAPMDSILFKNGIVDPSGIVKPSQFDVYVALVDRNALHGVFPIEVEEDKFISIFPATPETQGSVVLNDGTTLPSDAEDEVKALTGAGTVAILSDAAQDNPMFNAVRDIAKLDKAVLEPTLTTGYKIGEFTDKLGNSVDLFIPTLVQMRKTRIVASQDQTQFPLGFGPSGFVMMYRGGLLVDSAAFSVSGATLTYNPGAGYGDINAGEVIHFYGVA